jgi:apolipoprotein N-acyltransferase
MGIAPAPGNTWPLAWVALTPLWFYTQGSRIRRSLLLGLVWGIGYHGCAMSWISGLHPLTWMGISWPASVAITGFAWLMIALWGAVLSSLWSGVMAWTASYRSTGFRVLLGTTLWCSLEWLWMQGPLAWTSLSYTQSPYNLAILHLGQWSGPLGVTAALVAVNGLIAEAWLVRHRPRRLLYLAAGLCLGLHLLGWGLYRQPLIEAPAALRIGIIQGNIPTRIKLYEDGIRRSLENYTRGYQQLVAQGVDAVLTPEGALPFLWSGATRTQNRFYEAVREQGVVAWLGTFYPENGPISQSLVTLTGTGEVVSRYNKIKLVPLGEYIPFERTLGKLVARLSPVEAKMLPGEADQQLPTPFGLAIAGICFDSAFPQLFQQQTAAGGEFMLLASNNDPYSAVMMAQHHAQDVMRAIENDRWAVQATNTGYSSVIDPHGHTQWISGVGTYETHAATIYRRQTRTLYVRWGNWLLPLLIVITGGISFRLQFHDPDA